MHSLGKTHGGDASRPGRPSGAGYSRIGCCSRKSIESSVIEYAARRTKVVVGGHTHLVSIGSYRDAACSCIGCKLCPYCPGIRLVALCRQCSNANGPPHQPYQCPTTNAGHASLFHHTRLSSGEWSSGGLGLYRIDSVFVIIDYQDLCITTAATPAASFVT